MSVRCASCAAVVEASAMEIHLRRELRYFAFECGLCQRRFFTEAQAHHHFSGPFSVHKDLEPVILENSNAAVEEQMVDVMRRSELLDGLRLPKPTPPEPSRGGSRAESDESSELEDPPSSPPPPKRVKAELVAAPVEELKPVPQRAANGWVACCLCAKEVDKAHFSAHAIFRHLESKPFFCNLCQMSFKQKSDVKTHLKKVHDAALSLDTFTSTLHTLKDAIADKVAECFGAAENVRASFLSCGPCRVDVELTKARDHICSVHLQRAQFSCRRCDFASNSSRVALVRAHLKKVHGETGPDGIQDHRPQFEVIFKAAYRDAFGRTL